MNKYYVKIPYSFTQYGELTCFVYSEDIEDAYDLAMDNMNRHEEDYEEIDTDGTTYNYDDMSVSLEEENVRVPIVNSVNNNASQGQSDDTTNIHQISRNFPVEFFLAELHLV